MSVATGTEWFVENVMGMDTVNLTEFQTTVIFMLFVIFVMSLMSVIRCK